MWFWPSPFGSRCQPASRVVVVPTADAAAALMQYVKPRMFTLVPNFKDGTCGDGLLVAECETR